MKQNSDNNYQSNKFNIISAQILNSNKENEKFSPSDNIKLTSISPFNRSFPMSDKYDQNFCSENNLE